MSYCLKKTIRQCLEDLQEKHDVCDNATTIKLFRAIPDHGIPDIPSKYDISPTDGLHLDEQYALLHFYGKTSEEAVSMYAENPFHYNEDILFMGWNAFAYYIDTPYTLLLREKEEARTLDIGEEDYHPASDTAGLLLTLIAHHLDFPPANLLDQTSAPIVTLLLHLANIVADCAEIVRLDPPDDYYSRGLLEAPVIRGLVAYAALVRTEPNTGTPLSTIIARHRQNRHP